MINLINVQFDHCSISTLVKKTKKIKWRINRFYRFSVNLFEVSVDQMESMSSPEDPDVRHDADAGQNESHFLKDKNESHFLKEFLKHRCKDMENLGTLLLYVFGMFFKTIKPRRNAGEIFAKGVERTTAKIFLSERDQSSL